LKDEQSGGGSVNYRLLTATRLFNNVWNGSVLILQSPLDGSGVLSPSLTWDFSQNGSLVGSIFLPWGDEPSGGKIKSEYGGTPLSLFL